MKIYVNGIGEIKAINESTDETLTEIEVDRDGVFGDKSDFRILHYKYVVKDSGYEVTPAIDLNLLDKLEIEYYMKENSNKISILEQQNADLENALVELASIVGGA